MEGREYSSCAYSWALRGCYAFWAYGVQCYSHHTHIDVFCLLVVKKLVPCQHPEGVLTLLLCPAGHRRPHNRGPLLFCVCVTSAVRQCLP